MVGFKAAMVLMACTGEAAHGPAAGAAGLLRTNQMMGCGSTVETDSDAAITVITATTPSPPILPDAFTQSFALSDRSRGQVYYDWKNKVSPPAALLVLVIVNFQPNHVLHDRRVLLGQALTTRSVTPYTPV